MKHQPIARAHLHVHTLDRRAVNLVQQLALVARKTNAVLVRFDHKIICHRHKVRCEKATARRRLLHDLLVGFRWLDGLADKGHGWIKVMLEEARRNLAQFSLPWRFPAHRDTTGTTPTDKSGGQDLHHSLLQ